jgi:nucleoside-diphosphate-sugar epimerase
VTALVTGATGFLGRHLVRRLLARGDVVRILARSPAKAQPLVERGAKVVVGEVTDRTALREALDGVNTVYHLAGRLFEPGGPAEAYRRIHVDGTHALLELSVQRAHLRRFVHCSTTGVLGVTGDIPADENAPYRPTNAYEETKAEAERLVRDLARGGFPAAIVRPGLVYGPGDEHLLGLFRAIDRGMFRPIGSRSVFLHPIYIDDMTEAFVRCADDPRAIGEAFHIAGAVPVTIAELAATIAAAVGVPQPAGTIPLPLARIVAAIGDAFPPPLRRRAPLTRTRLDFLTHSRVYDVSKARTALGFEATTDLRTGIERSVAWYRNEGYLPARSTARTHVPVEIDG